MMGGRFNSKVVPVFVLNVGTANVAGEKPSLAGQQILQSGMGLQAKLPEVGKPHPVEGVEDAEHEEEEGRHRCGAALRR